MVDDTPEGALAKKSITCRDSLQTRLIGLRDDHDAFGREHLLGLSAGERMAMVWPMFVAQWLRKGGDAKQLQFRRDIACLQRRKGSIFCEKHARDMTNEALGG